MQVTKKSFWRQFPSEQLIPICDRSTSACVRFLSHISKPISKVKYLFTVSCVLFIKRDFDNEGNYMYLSQIMKILRLTLPMEYGMWIMQLSYKDINLHLCWLNMFYCCEVSQIFDDVWRALNGEQHSSEKTQRCCLQNSRFVVYEYFDGNST